MRLNLGCGVAPIEGCVNVDRHRGPGVDIICDLTVLPWPWQDGTFEHVRAHHILEHMPDLTAVMREIHRVCRPEATVDIVVPYASTLWDVANPEHVRRFNHVTFQYYCSGFISSDLGLWPGYEMLRQKLEREQDQVFSGVTWMVADLAVLLRVKRG